MLISKTMSGSFVRNVFVFQVLLVLYFTVHTSSVDAGGSYIPAPEGSASGISELRGGIFWHNVEDDNSSEDGSDLNVELLFNKPTWSHPNPLLHHLITPRPHIGGHINMSQSTSMFYFGLTWTYDLTDRLFFETSFGGAVHDGPLDEPGHSFGCSLNFRESASLGMHLTPSWDIMVTVDHMSNANLCDRNAGLTNLGVRMGYKFQ